MSLVASIPLTCAALPLATAILGNLPTMPDVPLAALLNASALPAAPNLADGTLNVVGFTNTFVKYVVFDIFYKAIVGWMLPLKSRCGYWTCCLVMQAIGYLVLVSGPSIPVRFLWYVADYALVPYLWWHAPQRLRVIAASLSVIGELFTEIMCMVFYSLFGLSLAELGSNNPLELVARLGTIAIFWGIIAMMRRFLGTRLTPTPANRAHHAAHTKSHTRDRGHLVFIVIQTLALTAFYIIFFCNGTQDVPLAWSIGALALTVVCAISSVIAMLSLQRYLRTCHERQRADALECELAAHVQASHALAAEGEQAARFRHDVRNHLQTLGLLIERGEVERARAYVADLRGRISKDDSR